MIVYYTLDCLILKLISPSAAYMQRWTGSALVPVMACRLFGANPLPEPMLTSCRFDPWKQTSGRFVSKYKNLHSRKCTWKCRLWYGGHFHGELNLKQNWEPLEDNTCRLRLLLAFHGLILRHHKRIPTNHRFKLVILVSLYQKYLNKPYASHGQLTLRHTLWNERTSRITLITKITHD